MILIAALEVPEIALAQSNENIPFPAFDQELVMLLDVLAFCMVLQDVSELRCP